MAIYQPGGAPIVNGLAVVMNGSNVAQSYTRDGAQTIPSGSLVNILTEPDGRYLAQQWAEGREVLPATSADINSAASGNDAVVYLPAQPGRHHVLFGVACGYDATPTGGALVIESPSGVPVFDQSVTQSGPNSFTWYKGIHGSGNADMLVRLKNGGQSKEVSLLGHRLE